MKCITWTKRQQRSKTASTGIDGKFYAVGGLTITDSGAYVYRPPSFILITIQETLC
jgi:hypothetical protein